MFRSCQIIIRELCSMLKLYYSIHNSIIICKRGVVAGYHVVWECVVEQWLSVLSVWECVVEQWLGVRTAECYLRFLSGKALPSYVISDATCYPWRTMSILYRARKYPLIISYSTLRQFHRILQCEFSKVCLPVTFLSISSYSYFLLIIQLFDGDPSRY